MTPQRLFTVLAVVVSTIFVAILLRSCHYEQKYRKRPLIVSEDSTGGLHGNPWPTTCCDESKSLNVQMIFEKSDDCSRLVNLRSVQCTCESLIVCKFMAVSAISDNHFEEATDFIASVQTYMPNTPIIVYNLGLNEKNKKTLSSYCNVKVRDLNFSKYPKHVQNLQTYAWKPIIIKEMYYVR